MGVKVKFTVPLALILSAVTFTAQVSAASLQPVIPAETMKIAHEAEIRASQLKPKSEVVRVGIATTGFETYDYNTVSIYGTDGIQVYNDGMSTAIFTIGPAATT